MSNPIYQQYGNQRTGMSDIMTRFNQFRRTFNGNPQQIIQNMLNSGRITQEQVNNAAQMANEMMKYMK